MGLLDKALIIDNSTERESVFSPDINRMMASLNSSSTGLDFPGTLFKHLVDEFHIEKGALLLPQDNSPYVPWAETGFDQTTLRRIRIPYSLVESLKNGQFYSFLELEKSDIESLKDYFSFREFSVTAKITIAPLFAEREIIALLFISKGEIADQSTGYKQKILKKLSDEAGPLLFEKRGNIINKLEIMEFNENSVEETISRYIGKHKESVFLLISVSISDFPKHFQDRNMSSLSFRIKQDILRLVKTLISNKGEVYSGDKDTLIIILKGERTVEAEMFVHQIGISMKYFFKITNSDYTPRFQVKKYPDDGKTAEELTSDFF